MRKKIIFSCMVFITFFFFLETFARIFKKQEAAYSPDSHWQSLQPYTMFNTPEVLNNQRWWVDSFQNKTKPAIIIQNKQGFPSEDKIDYSNKYVGSSDEEIVIITGGSAAWGVGASSNSQCVDGALQRMLNQQGRKKYKVINMAMGGWKSEQEFIALAKANPGQYNYASAGNGSASHLAMAYFNSMAGIQLVHIPTKGTGDAITELLAGRAQAVIAANVAALPFANDSRIRFLGVSSEKPSPFVPGVPPIGDTLKGYVFDSWFGLLAPASTPNKIITMMQSEMSKLLKQPEIIERMRRQGIEIGNLSPNEFNQLLVRDYVRMANVVKASGAKAE
jgi:hypothetical protein